LTLFKTKQTNGFIIREMMIFGIVVFVWVHTDNLLLWTLYRIYQTAILTLVISTCYTSRVDV
jgi:hypothetical protein